MGKVAVSFECDPEQVIYLATYFNVLVGGLPITGRLGDDVETALEPLIREVVRLCLELEAQGSTTADLPYWLRVLAEGAKNNEYARRYFGEEE